MMQHPESNDDFETVANGADGILQEENLSEITIVFDSMDKSSGFNAEMMLEKTNGLPCDLARTFPEPKDSITSP